MHPVSPSPSLPVSASSLDPDLEDHLARERAFDGIFAWPPLPANREPGTENRERFALRAWSIDRESALAALSLPGIGDTALDTALTALWLAAHDDDAITLLRIQSPARQYQTIRDWCRLHVRVSDRDAVRKLADDIFKAADENKTMPAHESGAASGNV